MMGEPKKDTLAWLGDSVKLNNVLYNTLSLCSDYILIPIQNGSK